MNDTRRDVRGKACTLVDGDSGLAHDRHGHLAVNHAERDVTAAYDRHSYDPEKRTARDAWAAGWRRSSAGPQARPESLPCLRRGGRVVM